MTVSGQVQYINPDTLNRNPAFTNVVVASGSVKTVYVGGQDAIDASGAIIGKGDLRAQTEQILQNIQAALAAGGAQLRARQREFLRREGGAVRALGSVDRDLVAHQRPWHGDVDALRGPAGARATTARRSTRSRSLL